MPRRRNAVLLAWLLTGVLMIWAAGVPPVQRTQEARVLETAREMLGRPARDWMVPRLNGAVRLRKPPLAYWLSAASMTVFGVNDRAGRLPATVLSWLSLAATFALARRWFGRRTAWLSTAALVSSFLFFKHGLLAETDALAAAFLTIGAWAVVRAVDGVPIRVLPKTPTTPWAYPTPTLPLLLTAVCLAGVILSKGPNAAFLPLFWAALCLLQRDWRSMLRFVTRGGLVTLLILAVPWFVYVAKTTADEGQLGADLTNSVDGGDHRGPPWAYVPMLLRAALPWTAIWLVALAMAGSRMGRGLRAATALYRAADTTPVEFRDSVSPARRAISVLTATRIDRGLWALTAWGASILLPLGLWGNKQAHYLLPLMPPTAILIGWAAMRWVRRAPSRKAAAARFRRSLYIAVAGMALMVILVAWLPARRGGVSARASAEIIAAYPNARFVFRGSELPVMSWTMRRAIPLRDDAAITAAAGDTATVVIEQQQDDEPEPTPPVGFVESRRIRQADNVLHVYVPAYRAREPNYTRNRSVRV